PTSTPLADAACEGLVSLAGTNVRLLEALETHCLKTKRAALAARVLELAVEGPYLAEDVALQQYHRIVELYLREANAPGKAIDIVEALLTDDPFDDVARAAAEKLLATPAVSKRAAAILGKVRRWVRDAEKGKARRPRG